MTLPTSVYSLLKSMDCLFELKTQTQSTKRLFLLGSPCPTMNSRVSGGWLCKQEDEGRVGYMGASVSKTGSPSAVASSKSPHRCLTGFPSYSHLSLLPRHTVHFEHVRSRRICRSLQVPSVHESPSRCVSMIPLCADLRLTKMNYFLVPFPAGPATCSSYYIALLCSLPCPSLCESSLGRSEDCVLLGTAHEVVFGRRGPEGSVAPCGEA